MDVQAVAQWLAGNAVTASLLVVVAVLSWVVIRDQLKWARVRSGLKGIPKPPGSLPILGHALELAKAAPWNTMERWVRENDGKVIAIDFLMKTGIIITNTAHIRKVFNTNQRNYAKDIELSYKPFMNLLGRGVVTSSGEDWKRKRKMVSTPFRFEILEETVDVAKRAVDRLSARLEAIRGSDKPIEMAEEFRLLTLEVIGELILSLSPEESRSVFPQLYLPIVTEANKRIWAPYRGYLPTPSNFRYNKVVGQLNKYMTDLLTRRWNERQARLAEGKPATQRPDILERIMSEVDPKDWNQDTVLDLRDAIKTFILAGHETSAAMMAWSLYRANKHPEVMEKILQEGRKVFSSPVGTPTDSANKFEASPLPSAKELNNLTYTVNWLKEALRMYTPVPVVTRYAVEDDKIEDIDVPAGTKVFVNIQAVHHDPKVWGDPEEFRPERFDDPELDSYAFLPFTQGPRVCLGQHLALLEARIVMSLLVQRFKFVPRDEHIGDVDEFTVPVAPQNGMHFFIR